MLKRLIVLSLFVFFPLLPVYTVAGGCGGNSIGVTGTEVSPDLASCTIDNDGDGVFNCNDSFPEDPSESTDTDGDGIGDNTDSDADGDGFENIADCNDLDAESFPGAPDDPDDQYADSNCDGMDGDAANAVWVSAVEGNDSYAGTIDAPVLTFAKALQIAGADPASPLSVYATAGDYPEDVLLQNNISIYGGFAPLVDGKRTRDLVTYKSVINGKDGDKNIPVVFDTKIITMNFSLAANSSDSTIDGFVIKGDNSIAVDSVSMATFIYNSGAHVRNCVISSSTPTANVSIAAAAVMDSGASGPKITVFEQNEILLNGAEFLSDGKDFGIIVLPTEDIIHELKVSASDNFIHGTAAANAKIGIYASAGDPTKLSIETLRNTIELSGASEAGIGIIAGGMPITSADTKYMNNVEIEANKLKISSEQVVYGIVTGPASGYVNIFNNVLNISDGIINYGINTINSPVNIINNTISILNPALTGNSGVCAGLMSSYSTSYSAIPSSPGFYDNNIIDISCQHAAGKCSIIGVMEGTDVGDDSKASPTSFRNNLINFEHNCTIGIVAHYGDSFNHTQVPITDIVSLNSGAGLLDPNDPTEFSGNIEGDPLFIDATLKPAATSPAVDGGYDTGDVSADIDGTLRPQGNYIDVGAFEQ